MTLCITGSGAADGPTPSSQLREAQSVSTARARVAAPEKCQAVRKGLAYYVRVTNEWRAKMGAGGVSAVPSGSVKGHASNSCPRVRYLAAKWRGKAIAAHRAYERWYDHQIRVVIERLERGLRGTPMSGTGRYLERWGRIYHVSPYFMAAVSGTESTFGFAACSSNRYNVWGLASCGGSWSVPAFGSWNEAIRFYAHFLSSRWPGHSTPYSFVGYAASVSSWGAKTSYYMQARFGVSNSTRYP